MKVKMLLLQSPYAQCFKRPKLETSEFGVRKGFLIREVTSGEDGSPSGSSNPS